MDGERENAPHEAPERTEVEQVHAIRMQELGIDPEALGRRWCCRSHPGRVIVVAFAVVLVLSLSRWRLQSGKHCQLQTPRLSPLREPLAWPRARRRG